MQARKILVFGDNAFRIYQALSESKDHEVKHHAHYEKDNGGKAPWYLTLNEITLVFANKEIMSGSHKKEYEEKSKKDFSTINQVILAPMGVRCSSASTLDPISQSKVAFQAFDQIYPINKDATFGVARPSSYMTSSNGKVVVKPISLANFEKECVSVVSCILRPVVHNHQGPQANQ